MYKLVNDRNQQLCAILRTEDGASIPFDPANTDYRNFKKEIAEDKAQLQDADGNVMTAEEAKAYIATLPA